MSKHFWLMARAILGLLLTLLFYGIALGMVIGLLGLIYLMVAHTRRLNFKVLAFCLTGAGAILWSLVPRRQEFEAPGLEIFPQDQPKLFNVIEEIAGATGQRMPDEVFLDNDINAAVSERGGFLGFGRKRMLLIGLPMLQAGTDIEIRGVIAHEFGHYCGGDTFLGPWIHATYYSLGRTIHKLEDSWLRYPFHVYARLYFLATRAVARQQEFHADSIAVQVAGPDAVKSFRERATSTTMRYHDYLNGCLLPLIDENFRLPILDGFGRMLKSRIYNYSAKQIQEYELKQKAGWYDTHPSVADLIKAIDELHAAPVKGSDEPAIRWIRNAERLATQLLIKEEHLAEFEKRPLVEWDELMDLYYIPRYRWMIDRFKNTIGQYKVGEIPLVISRPKDYILDLMKFHEVEKKDFDVFVEKLKDEWEMVMLGPLIYSISLALLEAGWQIEKIIGDPSDFISPDNPTIKCNPNLMLCSLYATMRGDEEIRFPYKTLTPDGWLKRTEALGIADLPLALAWDIPLKYSKPAAETYDLLDR